MSTATDAAIHTARKMQYKPGDALLSTGQTIERVIGQDAHTCVVITDDHQIRWEFQPCDIDTPPRLRPAVEALVQLSAFGRQVLRPGNRDGLRNDLAEALWASFETQPGRDVLIPFNDVRHRLEARWRRLATAAHFAGGLIVLIPPLLALGGAALFGKPSIYEIGTAILGGAIGALLSIMERIRRLEVDSCSPLWYWSLEGAFRVLLGVLSAGIVIPLINLDLFFGFAKGRLEGLFLAGVLAGFAERLIPSLLIQVARRSTTGK